MKFYEKFLSKKINNKFKFLKDRDKEICFEIFLTGLFIFIIVLLIKINYDSPLIWLLCSIFLMIGGALGMLPFSFIKNRNQRNRKE